MSAMPRPPGSWTDDELRHDAAEARQRFVAERLAALADEQRDYRSLVNQYAATARELLKASADLRDLTGAVLSNREFLSLARYLAVPMISIDDLDTLTDSCFGLWVEQKTDQGVRPSDDDLDAAARIIGERLDEDRAPWLRSGTTPTSFERETFIYGIAAIRAASRLVTSRRTARSKQQEAATRQAVAAASYLPVKLPGTIDDPVAEMPSGTYSSQSRKLAGTNMDVPIRLHDRHPTGQLFLAVECKASNSTLNSRKRLLEVNSKKDTWDTSGLPHRFRTAALLAGVFDVKRLAEAQNSGVYIFWEHRLSDLTDFLK